MAKLKPWYQVVTPREVSFEAKVDRDQAEAKTNETKAALRELGLDDSVTT